MNRRVLQRISILALLIAAIPGRLFAGPPLAIDDPGVLDPGQWEIIVAATMASTPEGEGYEAPILDVSYGLTPNTQASIVYQYVFVEPDIGTSESDFGNLGVGYKWRFINNDNLQIAFAPAYAFGVSSSKAAQGIGDETDALFLPLDLQYDFGPWSLLAEFGYESVESDQDAWAYGAALMRMVGERTQVMFELYGGADTDFDNDELNFHIGVDVELVTDLHLLASAGSGLREPRGATELDFDIFLGLQYFR
jgi:hypothetical protein